MWIIHPNNNFSIWKVNTHLRRIMDKINCQIYRIKYYKGLEKYWRIDRKSILNDPIPKTVYVCEIRSDNKRELFWEDFKSFKDKNEFKDKAFKFMKRLINNH